MADFGTRNSSQRGKWYDEVFNPLGHLVLDLEELAGVDSHTWYTPIGSRASWMDARLHQFNIQGSDNTHPDGPVYFEKVNANWLSGHQHLSSLVIAAWGFDSFVPEPAEELVWQGPTPLADAGILISFWRQNFVTAAEVVGAEAEAETEAIEAVQGAFSLSTLSPTEQNQMLQNAAFSSFFENTFDTNTITLIPVIYNLYLTSLHFPGINKAFENPKDRVLDIILSTIANDNNFDSNPLMTRPAAAAAIANSTGQDQLESFNSASRDFILKMLIKTPIDILKGLVELIDPHIAISKVIKTGTGLAFNALVEALEVPAQAINSAVAENSDLEPNLNGEGLLQLVLCLIDRAMTSSLPPHPSGEIPENFFPRISADGVDFTGTVSGLLMIPPSPLGLLYLLLELIKSNVTNETQNVDGANTSNANSNEC